MQAVKRESQKEESQSDSDLCHNSLFPVSSIVEQKSRKEKAPQTK